MLLKCDVSGCVKTGMLCAPGSGGSVKVCNGTSCVACSSVPGRCPGEGDSVFGYIECRESRVLQAAAHGPAGGWDKLVQRWHLKLIKCDDLGCRDVFVVMKGYKGM